jgi:nitrate/nitrite transport system ATP-binding protein
MALLELKGVSKRYVTPSTRTDVLRDVNLMVEQGELVAIVGYSGAGKTTLVSLVAGLLAPDEGTILFHGEPVRGPGPERGVVFQSYSLLPWMSVYENVLLAVDQVFPTWSREKRKEHTERYVAMVGLTPARDKKPSQLSGGMRQRVAVARALAMEPEMLLLDEPLSALDALTRGNLQAELDRICRSSKKTILLITNDVDEGLLLADRIIPLGKGPGATLGPSFAVDIPCPRDRRALNHDPRFKELRGAIIDYLLHTSKPQTIERAADESTPVALQRPVESLP